MDFFDFINNKKNIVIICSIIINILLITGFIFYYYQNNNNYNLNDTKCECNCEDTKNKDFFVEVKGAVANPQVYKVNSNNIVNDLINLAGGFTKDAYTKNINLSKKLSNEMVIYVYTNKEYKKNETKNNIVTCETTSYDISNCTTNKTSNIIVSNKDTSFDNNDTLKLLVNINTASKEELLTLSGIGESKADEIIKYREENGLFKSIEELTNVSGIGNALFEKIKDNIRV